MIEEKTKETLGARNMEVAATGVLASHDRSDRAVGPT